MLRFLQILIIVCFLPLFSLAQRFEWAKSAGGTINDVGISISVDASGNSYVTGRFDSPTISFGLITVIGPGLFVVKYDANGNVVWAKSAGETNNDFSRSISVDASGNCFITGNFDGINISFGSTTLANANPGTSDIFVAKYDANGNVVWAKSAGGTDNDLGSSISVDASGNCFITGNFNSLTISFGSSTLTSAGTSDIFVAKYDVNGNVVWAKSAGNIGNDYGQSISIDDSGNCFITGRFNSQSITLGATILTNANSAGTSDIFVAKYDVNGNVVWAKSAGGTDNDLGSGISVDASGNCFIIGYFGGPTISFGSSTLTSAGTSDIFVAKYDRNGNVLWAKSAGGPNTDSGRDLSVDTSGNCFITGSFNSPTISFGSFTLTNAGDFDIFVAKYDPNGNAVWAKSVGGPNTDFSRDISVDASANCFITGSFNSPIIAFGENKLTSAGGSDVFVTKIRDYSNLKVNPLIRSVGIELPVTFKWPKDASAITYNLKVGTDENISSPIINATITNPETTFVASTLNRGTQYYWQVTSENITASKEWFFGTFTTQLDSPQLASPTQNANNINLKPTLSWTSVFASARYILQLSVQSDFSALVKTKDTTSTSFITDSLLRGTTYYWRVKAYIPGDTTAWSTARYFTTVPNVPSTPTLIYPADVATNVPVNAVICWSKVSDADSYAIQISTSPQFSTYYVNNSGITDTSFIPNPFFNSNTMYFGRVNATNVGGTSGYGTPFRFTTASIRHVPAQYATIQAALNAAQSGDTVLVQPGTYIENIIWPIDRNLKLISAGDSSNTIIDGNNLSIVISIDGTGLIDTNSIIRGFKIINGNGAGIMVTNSTPIIENIALTRNNTAGIKTVNANILLRNSKIYSNNGDGGYFKKGTIRNCEFTNNSDKGISGFRYSIFDSDIRDNLKGGIWITEYAIIRRTRVEFNSTNDSYGIITAISQTSGDLELSDSYIGYNTAIHGSIIYSQRFGVKINKSIVVHNNSNYSTINGTSIRIDSSTITENAVKNSYSGLLTATQINYSLLSNNSSKEGITLSDSINNSTFYSTGSIRSSLRPVLNSNIVKNGFGLYNTNSIEQLDATNNYWGDVSGPYHPSQNPFGRGDSVNLYVNVVPFLTSPSPTAPLIPLDSPQIINIGATFLTISWDKSLHSNISGYKIYYDTDSIRTQFQNCIDVGLNTTYTLQNLFSGHIYYMAVTAYDNLGRESYFSREVSTTTVPPLLSVCPSTTFNNTIVNDSSYKILSIISQSSSALTISSISNNAPIFQKNVSLPIVVKGLDTLKLSIAFKPIMFGTVTDTLKITSDGGNASVVLTGTSPHPMLVANQSSVTFGAVACNSTKQLGIKIMNSSINTLTIDTAYTKTSVFALDKSNGTVGTDTLALNVTFSPITVGSFVDTLYLRNNSTIPLVKIPLSGVSPTPAILCNLKTIAFGDVGIYDSSKTILKVANSSVNALTIDSIYTQSTVFTSMSSTGQITNKDTATITVRFKPVKFGAYLDTLFLRNNSDTTLFKIPLSGNTPYSTISVLPSSIAFGEIKKDSTSQLLFRITNSSISVLQIDSLWTKTKYYNVTHSLADGRVKKGDSVRVTIRFTPDTARSYVDTMFIANNSPVSPLKVPLSGIGTLTGVDGWQSVIPSVFSLSQNYPNPFNPSTTIRYGLPTQSNVRLVIYNILGQIVKELINTEQQAGYQSVVWNANAASGLYFYRIEATSKDDPNKRFVETKKMLLLH